ncbi:hypothetical protein SH528x_002112 [Novipirellula sp. SH528]|uniref:hypothetical protein n=1 Tax=Novipirellula sp. SH528 TaxID=3454466 RepID=UPI003FA04CB3
MTISDSDYLPHKRRCVGSSYLIQQSPGAECVGGLEIQISTPDGETGTLLVDATLWPGGEPAMDLSTWTKPAIRGLEDYAEANAIALRDFDIVMRRFLVHEVDSMPMLYYCAAQNAMESALNAWCQELPYSTRNHRRDG